MNKKTKKLVLAKETLRELNPADLQDLVGGVVTTTSDLCSVESRCCTQTNRPINCNTW
jgi:hypothetical protein